jgi:hypothetical protein
VIAKEHMENYFAKKKPEPEPPLDKIKVMKMMKNLYQPEPRLSSNYDRSIRKSTEATKLRSKSVQARNQYPGLENRKTRAPRSKCIPMSCSAVIRR